MNGAPISVSEAVPPWLEARFVALAAERTAPSVLVIGCGDGVWLARAFAAGVEPFGMEANAGARDAARRRCPSAYVAATIEEVPPHLFDLILLSSVPSPTTDLHEIFYELAAKNAFDQNTTVIVKENAALAAKIEATLRHLRFNRSIILEGPDGPRYEASGSDFAQFMQERYIPGTWSEIAAYEHMPRYAYACSMADNVRVLDFGCGSGYGSALLADVARSVVGLDISEDALVYARDYHKHPGLEFVHDAAFGASLPDGSFDLIVCFEVIEHLDTSMQVELLTAALRLLAPGGKLLISTPNPQVTAIYGENPYHLRELTQSEFQALLREHFPHVGMIEQSVHASVLFEPLASSGYGEIRDNVPDMAGTRKPAIYVAVCSTETLSPLHSIVYPDRARDYISMRIRALTLRNQQLIERYRLVHTRDVLTRTEASRAAETAARQAADETTRSIQADHQLLQAKHATALSEAKADANELRIALADAIAKTKRIEARLQIAAKQSHALRVDLEHATLELSELRATYDMRGEQLAQTEARLAAIQGSTAWRALERAAPLLKAARPVLRPIARGAWRLLPRANRHSLAPSPVTPFDTTIEPITNAPARDMLLETELDPVWNPASATFVLQRDEHFLGMARPSGVLRPYVVRPIAPVDEAIARPTILHVIPNVYIGGSTQLVIDLVQHLSPFFRHEVLTSDLWPGGAHVGLVVHHVATPSVVKMTEVMDSIRPDLVHVHYWGLTDDPWYHAAVAVLADLSVPALQNINTPITPLIDPVFLHYVFVSEYVRQTFGGSVTGLHPTSVIHPGIDLSLFGTSNPTPDRDNAVGMVYRLEDDKLTEDAIDLFIEIVRRRPRTKVFIIGGGSFLQPYLERTEQAGVRTNFRFTGYVPYETLPDWYDKFAVFVAPVWQESFGQVAPFAMRKQAAVAGYAVGALPEILGSRETLGESLEQTAAIVAGLLDDPVRLHELGRRNQIRATEFFAVEVMVAQYRAIYESLLTGRE